MSRTGVIKSCLLALLPVVGILALWILYRADDLVRVTVGLPPGFFAPVSAAEAFLHSYLIWILAAIVFSFICGGFYYWATRKWHWNALVFAFVLTGAGVVISLLAYLTTHPLIIESTGELIILAIGFGVFIPWFDQKNLRNYS